MDTLSYWSHLFPVTAKHLPSEYAQYSVFDKLSIHSLRVDALIHLCIFESYA
jgi:hypothetical protein